MKCKWVSPESVGCDGTDGHEGAHWHWSHDEHVEREIERLRHVERKLNSMLCSDCNSPGGVFGGCLRCSAIEISDQIGRLDVDFSINYDAKATIDKVLDRMETMRLALTYLIGGLLARDCRRSETMLGASCVVKSIDLLKELTEEEERMREWGL